MGNIIYALAICFVAMKTPKFLQEFMIQTGGGSVMGAVHHTTSVVKTVGSIFAKKP